MSDSNSTEKHQIIPFFFEKIEVRAISVLGTPYFIAKDIASALGYSDTDQAVRMHCKKAKTLPVNLTGQVRKIKVIAEADIYRLVLKSKLESAERFQDWVVEEVLPSIRKTGSYAFKNHDENILKALKMLPIAFKAARILKLDKNETLLSANRFVMQETGINMLEKLGHQALVSESQKVWRSVTEIGKQVNLSAQSTNKILEKLGLQQKIHDVWVMTDLAEGYARVFDSGKKHSNGVSIQQLKWCDDVISLIEQELKNFPVKENTESYRIKHLEVINTEAMQ
jgi:prophage antirepressor-like protein